MFLYLLHLKFYRKTPEVKKISLTICAIIFMFIHLDITDKQKSYNFGSIQTLRFTYDAHRRVRLRGMMHTEVNCNNIFLKWDTKTKMYSEFCQLQYKYICASLHSPNRSFFISLDALLKLVYRNVNEICTFLLAIDRVTNSTVYKTFKFMH